MRKFTEEMAQIIAELYEMYKTNPSVYEKSKLKYVERGYLKLIEQNPHKDSPYAIMKRQGYDVIQVLYKSFYVGVIINGVLFMYAGKGLKKVANLEDIKAKV